MKFEIALEFMRKGFKLTRKEWDGDEFICFKHVNSDYGDEMSSLCIAIDDMEANDWAIYQVSKPEKEKMNILTAMDYMDMGYKIRRDYWSSGIYIKYGTMYRDSHDVVPDVVCEEDDGMLDTHDVKANDWVAYK
jgi:hypothetical protein